MPLLPSSSTPTSNTSTNTPWIRVRGAKRSSSSVCSDAITVEERSVQTTSGVPVRSASVQNGRGGSTPRVTTTHATGIEKNASAARSCCASVSVSA
jgi:hypothetical protein